MNPESSTPTPSSIEDTAIAWLAERDDGFTLTREQEFAQWMQGDPRHAAAIARLEQALGLLNEMPRYRPELNGEFGRVAPVVPFPPAATRASSGRPGRMLAWVGLAAACVLCVVFAGRILHPPAAEKHHATTVAGYERARLEDGSMIELNAASAVRVRFTPAERRVEIERGEAHFDVVHDENRPFVVVAGGVCVRAVGTAFNVRFAGSAIEVMVSEGKVRVARGEVGATIDALAPLVLAGQRARVEREVPAPVIDEVTPDVLRAALAWQGRLVEFADAPLAQIVTRFNARNRLQLVLTDATVGSRRIGGTFDLDEVEAFVRLLERDGEIVGERRGDTEIVLRHAR